MKFSNDMGVKVESSEIIIKFIIYYLIVSASCDIKLITCDIHQMIQSYYNNSRNRDGVVDIDTSADFKINNTELEQHIMNGLNMKSKPDASLVSWTQHLVPFCAFNGPNWPLHGRSFLRSYFFFVEITATVAVVAKKSIEYVYKYFLSNLFLDTTK